MNLQASEVRSRRLLALAAAGIIATIVQGTAQAGIVYISGTAAGALTSDPANVSSYNNSATGSGVLPSGGYWDSGAAPAAGNDYYARKGATGGKYEIRTPGGVGGTLVFAGDSLHLPVSGSNLRLKSNGGATFDVNLYATNGTAVNGEGAKANYTLKGQLHVDSTSAADGKYIGTLAALAAVSVTATAMGDNTYPGIPANLRSLTIQSTISGSGLFAIIAGGGSGNVILDSGNNTGYSGLTYVRDTWLVVNKDGALGSGNVQLSSGEVVTSPAKLTLQNGATNDYIDDGAYLILPANLASGAVNLNFGGTDNIKGISFDGGTSFLTQGTFGAGATNPGGVFTGSGFIAVPEPATLGLLSLAGLVLMRRRNG